MVNKKLFFISLVVLSIIITLIFIFFANSFSINEFLLSSTSKTSNSLHKFFSIEQLKNDSFKHIMINTTSTEQVYHNQTTQPLTSQNPKIKTIENLFCMILTVEKSIATKALAVMNTWSQYCHQRVFSCNCPNKKRLQELS